MICARECQVSFKCQINKGTNPKGYPMPEVYMQTSKWREGLT